MKRACTLCHVIGFCGFGGVVCIANALQYENSRLLCFLTLPFAMILAISALLNRKLPPEDKATVISFPRYIFHPYTNFLFVTFSQIALFLDAFGERDPFTERLFSIFTILFICAILFTSFYLLWRAPRKNRK